MGGTNEQTARINTRLETIKDAFNHNFLHQDGTYGNNGITSYALPLAFNIAPVKERKRLITSLVQCIRAGGHRSLCGIFGAKYAPRILAEYGFIDDAYAMLTSTKYPSMAWSLNHGATTLWEFPDGSGSLNHLMFGSIAEWCFRYLAGFRHISQQPGKKFILIQPSFPRDLKHISAEYLGYRIDWNTQGENITGTVFVPLQAAARLILPDHRPQELSSGRHIFHCRKPRQAEFMTSEQDFFPVNKTVYATMNDSTFTNFVYRRGCHLPEDDGTWLSKDNCLVFSIAPTGNKNKLSFYIAPYSYPNKQDSRITITINDSTTTVIECLKPGEFSIPLPLSLDGSYKIRFQASDAARPMDVSASNKDQRLLSIKLISLRVSDF